MNKVLARWNSLDQATAAQEILPCCGSRVWADRVASRRPFKDARALEIASAEVWQGLEQADWQEAFDSHPRIGQKHAQTYATEQALRWSELEQRNALPRNEQVRPALQEANQRYEQKFGRIFIVCASGKSSSEILNVLEFRMGNDAAKELLEAAEQQRQITALRLHRWLESD